MKRLLPTPRLTGPATAWLLLGLLAVAPAGADDVHLTNGQTFEGVAVEVTSSQVRILMAGGEMRLPRTLVARIEESESPYREYLDRKADLGAGEESDAGAWLELARWALGEGLTASAREAARTAALLDPDLPGLPVVMRRLGYGLDEVTGRWVRGARAAAQRPAVDSGPSGGVPGGGSGAGEVDFRRQIASEIRRAAEEARQREEEIAAARREAAEEVRRVMEEARARPPAAAEAGLYLAAPLVYAVPVPFVVVKHGTVPPALPPTAPPALPPNLQSRPTVLPLLERQPGSLIPGVLDLGRR